MKDMFNLAVVSIGFFWLGLICAPGTGSNADIIRVGLAGTAGAVLAFGLGAYVKRQKKPGTPTRHHG